MIWFSVGVMVGACVGAFWMALLCGAKLRRVRQKACKEFAERMKQINWNSPITNTIYHNLIDDTLEDLVDDDERKGND